VALIVGGLEELRRGIPVNHGKQRETKSVGCGGEEQALHGGPYGIFIELGEVRADIFWA
jgi:hypothetical protein